MHAHDRAGLERLCKYDSRPPISLERLRRTDDGGLVLGFKRPMADGSTGVHLTPMELLRRLAALVPPPGFHLVGYHGVFAAHSTHRPLIVPRPPTEAAEPPGALIDGFSIGPPQAEEDLVPPDPLPRTPCPALASTASNAPTSPNGLLDECSTPNPLYFAWTHR